MDVSCYCLPYAFCIFAPCSFRWLISTWSLQNAAFIRMLLQTNDARLPHIEHCMLSFLRMNPHFIRVILRLVLELLYFMGLASGAFQHRVVKFMPAFCAITGPVEPFSVLA